MSDNEDNQVHVKTGITVHQLSKISSHETSIKVNMEVYFTYDEDEVIDLFFQPTKKQEFEQNKEKEEFKKDFKFPFLIANANEIDFYKYWTSYKYFNLGLENNLKDDNKDNSLLKDPNNDYHTLFGVPQKDRKEDYYAITEILKDGETAHDKITDIIKIDRKEDTKKDYDTITYVLKKDSTKKLKLEKYMITCELEVYNFTEKIPFNEVYIPIKIITNGGPNTNKIQFLYEVQSNINWKWSIETLDKGFWPNFFYSCDSKGKNQFDCIATRIVKLKAGEDYDEEYDRVYFLRIFRFNFWEDIVKYYLIPSLLTVTIILFYDIDKSDFSGLFSTIILGDIALLFIQPETNNLTYNEHSVHLNIGLVLILTLLRITNVNIHTLWYSFGVILVSVANFIHNYIHSYNFFKDKRKTLSKGGKYMADFDREIYGESISECKIDSKSPKNINSNTTRALDYHL